MPSKSSGDAARFLLRMWTDLGISVYQYLRQLCGVWEGVTSVYAAERG